jgi:hypothetical protein
MEICTSGNYANKQTAKQRVHTDLHFLLYSSIGMEV